MIGRKHRFGYEMSAPELGGSDSPLEDPGAIIKYDRFTGARTSIELGKGRSPGEAVFVPAENPSSEDDGYLMTYVFDKSKNTSDFVIFDAKTMSQEPVASVHLPRVPFGFHGNWIDASTAN